MNDAHPMVAALFFAVVLVFTAILAHPYICVASLVFGFSYCVYLYKNNRGRLIMLGIIVIISTAAINALFTHRGATILFYLPGGNPFTLESIVFGAIAGARLAAALFWFACVTKILTGEKIVFLLGRILPNAALTLSLSLSFVPRFISRAQGLYKVNSLGAHRSPISRVALVLRLFPALVSFALDSAVSSALTMKSRGYGVSTRAVFSAYKFSADDVFAALWISALAIGVIVLLAAGAARFSVYPAVGGAFGAQSVLCAATFGLLAITPYIILIVRNVRWKISLS